MGKLTKKRGTKYLGSQIWESQMPVFFSPRCALSPNRWQPGKSKKIISLKISGRLLSRLETPFDV